MATRKIVPRATNEGGIGTSSKKWASGYFTDLSVTNAIAGSVTGSAATLTTGRTINGVTFNGSANIVVAPLHYRFTIASPAAVYAVSSVVPLVLSTDAAITITRVNVSCDADPTTEVAGDLKWADAYIGLANATVINDFDTTAGVRDDSSITAGNVASGKCIYISFDASPDAATKAICFDITYVYQ